MAPTNDNTLTSPLLSSDTQTNTMGDSATFPNEAAARVKLLVPKKWKASGSTLCYLQYDVTSSLLHIVSDEIAGKVLDVIDPYDLIGASISLEASNEGSNNNSSSEAASLVPGRAANEPQTDTLMDRNGAAVLTLYCYPQVNPANTSWMSWLGVTSSRPGPNPDYTRQPKSEKFSRAAHHRSFRLAPTEDLSSANQVLTALKKLANPTVTDKPPRYLIVVNPNSGPKKNGAKVCETIVQPMLEEAGIDVDVIITTHANHGSEIMEKKEENDITSYDGLVLIGGDGIIHEAMNGIMIREDAEAVTKSLKVGVVGSGSCNGYHTSLTFASKEKYGPVSETFLIAKGQTTRCDLSVYQTSNTSRKYFSHLSFTWGMVSDIDIDSEVIRWIGEFRNDIWGALMMLRLRKYPGKISYLPADQVEDRSKPITNMPALTENVPQNWVTVEDDIVLLWVSHVTHTAMHTITSPNSKLGDNIFKLLLVRGRVSRFRMTLILLGLESGTHLGQPFMEEVDCCAFRVEPSFEVGHRRVGKNVVDGELVEAGPVQGHVLPSSIQVFCNPEPVDEPGNVLS